MSWNNNEGSWCGGSTDQDPAESTLKMHLNVIKVHFLVYIMAFCSNLFNVKQNRSELSGEKGTGLQPELDLW